MFSQANKSEGADDGAPKDQNHTSDQSPPTQEEPPEQVDPPEASEPHEDEGEAEQEGVKCPLSSSVIVDMPSVHSSLELSTIAGTTSPTHVIDSEMIYARISDDISSDRVAGLQAPLSHL